MDKAQQLSELMKEMALGSEAVAAGIATTESLAGGPPSTDLTYVLPEARSAVVFSVRTKAPTTQPLPRDQ